MHLVQPSTPMAARAAGGLRGACLSWVSGAGPGGLESGWGPGGRLGCADGRRGTGADEGRRGTRTRRAGGLAGTRLSLRSRCALTLSSGARPAPVLIGRRSHAHRLRPEAPPPAPAAGARSGRSPSQQPGPRGRGARPSPCGSHTSGCQIVQSGRRGLGAQCQAPHASLGCGHARFPEGPRGRTGLQPGKTHFPSSFRLLGTILEGPMEEVMHRPTAKQCALFTVLSGTESRVGLGVRRPWRRPWREDHRSRV